MVDLNDPDDQAVGFEQGWTIKNATGVLPAQQFETD
jgi:hypothetical protein